MFIPAPTYESLLKQAQHLYDEAKKKEVLVQEIMKKAFETQQETCKKHNEEMNKLLRKIDILEGRIPKP